MAYASCMAVDMLTIMWSYDVNAWIPVVSRDNYVFYVICCVQGDKMSMCNQTFLWAFVLSAWLIPWSITSLGCRLFLYFHCVSFFWNRSTKACRTDQIMKQIHYLLYRSKSVLFINEQENKKTLIFSNISPLLDLNDDYDALVYQNYHNWCLGESP